MKNSKIVSDSVRVMFCITAAVACVGCGKSNATEGNVDAEQSNATGQSNSSVQADTGSDPLLPALNIIDDKYRTTYEIFVYSFCDSDGDGIGDLKGVTKMLDYINDGDNSTDTDLGCNEIWLMPVAPSTTYHKYDVVDYMDIDPQYGTMDDFDELIKACHERGIRVIVDTVFNHSSSEHPWFKEATAYLKEHPDIVFLVNGDKAGISESTDGTNITNGDDISGEDSIKEAGDEFECKYLDYYNFSNEKMDGYEQVPGTGYYYEARFWSGMPDLNLDSSALRDELKDITQFWTEHGVDGFRLDACTYFYTGDDIKNVEFLTWLNDTVKSQNPDAYIVGEAWTSSATYNKYYESGVDSFFDFDYAGSEGIIAGVARGTTPASRYGEALEKTQEALSAVNENAIDAPFYTNHDMARSSGYYTGKNASDKLKLSAALNLLMPGNAFIYYGEELGMKGSGKDENKRAPMYWTAGVGSANASLSVPSWLNKPEIGMCKGPKDMDDVKMKYSALDEQYGDPYSIYNYYKMAIRLRNTYPCIARGATVVATDLSDSDICAFVRSMDSDAIGNNAVSSDGTSFTDVLIVINTSEEVKEVSLAGQVAAGKGADTNGTSGDTFELAGYSKLSYQLNTSEQVSTLDGGELSIAPFGVCVLTR